MRTQPRLCAERWEDLLSASEEFTCYSAAVATWLAADEPDWSRVVNPGLWLTITDAGDGLLGFAYFQPRFRSELGLVRTGSDDPGAAVDGVLAEIERSGRVIVAADGFNLPWHVACGRRHLPHWFVVMQADDGLEVMDPFACRNALGVQQAARQPVGEPELPRLLPALPGDDPVHRLREILAFGDEATEAGGYRHQWFVRGDVGGWRPAAGAEGPAAVQRLAEHFHRGGQDPAAYVQADDIWSIARHRAFLARHARACAEARSDGELGAWVQEHAGPLAKRWGHIGPLLMQATLTLSAGRGASASVPDTLEELAERERQAAQALPVGLDPDTI